MSSLLSKTAKMSSARWALSGARLVNQSPYPVVAKRVLGQSRRLTTESPVTTRDSIISKLSLDGKVTAITGICVPSIFQIKALTPRQPGGSRGIGLGFARTAAALGSDVAILDVEEPDTSLDQLQNDYGTRFFFHR